MDNQTFFDKVWNRHVVRNLGDEFALLYIDRLLLHELSGVRGLVGLERQNIAVSRPDLQFATLDHTISTAVGRNDTSTSQSAEHLPLFRQLAKKAGIPLADLDQSGQGIVHVVAPELGLVLPGTTFACGDSHTCTNGAMGAIAWGIGTADLELALATQTAILSRPKTMRIKLTGLLGKSTSAKDVIMHVIGQIGSNAGSGYAVEYAGPLVEALDIEQRLTLCSMSIEFGALFGMIAPDDVTFEYLSDREFAPQGKQWEMALREWRALPSSKTAAFHSDITIDCADLRPQVSWGNSAGDVLPIDGIVPEPSSAASTARRTAIMHALDYMGLEPGKPIEGLPVDWVFIGSCSNSRLGDLRAAASLLKGRKVSPNVRAWAVPGSTDIKRMAEAEGLDKVFRDAGFDWREAGCSMCLGANGEIVGAQERCLSTSNRNFVGRQGPGSRTHLASPLTAAATAITGRISDPRKLQV